MGYYDSNIYYSPEKFGLETVGDIDFDDDYGFDIFVVWRETATGRLGYGEDSGCSCPSPFEDFTPEDIVFDEPWKIALKLQERANQIKARGWGHVSENDVVHLIDKVVNP